MIINEEIKPLRLKAYRVTKRQVITWYYEQLFRNGRCDTYFWKMFRSPECLIESIINGTFRYYNENVILKDA